jgi:hypothetical protein
MKSYSPPGFPQSYVLQVLPLMMGVDFIFAQSLAASEDSTANYGLNFKDVSLSFISAQSLADDGLNLDVTSVDLVLAQSLLDGGLNFKDITSVDLVLAQSLADRGLNFNNVSLNFVLAEVLTASEDTSSNDGLDFDDIAGDDSGGFGDGRSAVDMA